jgi:hypothetical protein
MKVSFWHLFFLYPALFFYQATPRKQPATQSEPERPWAMVA